MGTAASSVTLILRFTRYYTVSKPVDLLNSTYVRRCIYARITNRPGERIPTDDGDPISMEIGGSLCEYLIYQLITAAPAAAVVVVVVARRRDRLISGTPNGIANNAQ